MNEKHTIKDLADLYKLIPEAEPPNEKRAETTDRITSFVTLHVRFEKKGRKGKGVTIIKGFHHTKDDLEQLAKELKTICGAGGTVKDESIEIQGDHREKTAGILKQRGFRIKLHK